MLGSQDEQGIKPGSGALGYEALENLMNAVRHPAEFILSLHGTLATASVRNEAAL